MNTIQTVADVTSLVKRTFRVKLFFIVGVCTFVLGLGIGLTTGIYYGYKKWTKKVDTLMEQSKEYRKTIMEKVKEKI